MEVARKVWSRFRGWPSWAQVLSVLMVLAIAGGALGGGDGEPVVVTASATTGVEEPPTSTARASTTTRPTVEAPEGGYRSGSAADDVPEGVFVPDEVDRGDASSADLELLATLMLEPEAMRTGYDRDLFRHWDDEDDDGCDTRCEVLAAQRHADGMWLSAWDAYSTDDPSELHIDHVVALAEAWDSGANEWAASQRDEFADDRANLLAVTAASNLRKSDKDAAEWFPSNSGANCLWARTVVHVKAEWSLSVDRAEHDALENLLTGCAGVASAGTATAAPTTNAPSPTSPPTTTASPSPHCTPGYSPCIPPGEDVDCAGGEGNGPRYVEGPVSVDHSYGDPYDLDRNGDGLGCET